MQSKRWLVGHFQRIFQRRLIAGLVESGSIPGLRIGRLITILKNHYVPVFRYQANKSPEHHGIRLRAHDITGDIHLSKRPISVTHVKFVQVGLFCPLLTLSTRRTAPHEPAAPHPVSGRRLLRRRRACACDKTSQHHRQNVNLAFWSSLVRPRYWPFVYCILLPHAPQRAHSPRKHRPTCPLHPPNRRPGKAPVHRRR